MIYLTKNNYISIEGLIQRITARQKALFDKYATINKKTFLEVATDVDLKEWQTLESDFNDLKPIYDNLQPY